MGLSIEPASKDKKSPEQSNQSEQQDQSTMIDNQPKFKFDTSNRNIKEEQVKNEFMPTIKSSDEYVNMSESKELCRSESKELCQNNSYGKDVDEEPE